MASTYLTNGLTAGSGTTGTVSLWVKRANLGTSTLYHFFEDNVTFCRLRFDSSDKLHWETYDNNTSNGKFKTNRLFRDTSAYYHIVVRVDTTQSTEADRFKLYVNGSEETSFSTSNYPTQNRDVKMTAQPYIGTEWQGSGVNYFDGNMTHIHYTDGQSYDASTFGETDSTSGIWKPKTAPSVTYGSKGFFLKFENSGSMGTDSSGNGNNFTTIGGTLTQNVDTPSNNYATLTPLYTIEYKSAQFFTNGNTTTNSNTTQWNTVPCTLEVSSGKWYFEGYGHTNGSHYVHYGITSSAKMIANATQAQSEINANANGYAYSYYGNSGNIYYSTTSSGGQDTSYGNSYGSTDYIGVFADLDNNKIYFAKNGTLQNSGTGYDISADGKPYILATAVYNGLTNVNFGSGVFGSTALTGTTYSDANGHGTFKYSPNQGGAANFDSTAKNFYAMNSKNLKEFG